MAIFDDEANIIQFQLDASRRGKFALEPMEISALCR